MANEKNLRVPTSEQAREYGRRGGIKSAEKRKAQKELRDAALTLLGTPFKKGKIDSIEKLKSIADAKKLNLDAGTLMLLIQLQKALKGDLKAAEFLRDTSGQKPVDQQEINATVDYGMLGDVLSALDEDEDAESTETEEK